MLSITQTAHGFAVGDVVRLNSTTYVKAQADSAAHAEVAGMVSAVADADHFSLALSGRVTGLSSLTAGSVYFLDPSTAGAITATEPTTVGQVSKPILIADTTTSGLLFNFRGELVTAADGFHSVKVYKSTSQSIPNNSTTEFTFDGERWDTDGYADPAVSSGRPTVPTGLGGKYRVTMNIECQAFNGGVREAYIDVNGNPTIESPGTYTLASFAQSPNAGGWNSSISGTIVLADAAVVAGAMYQNSGSALTVVVTLTLERIPGS